MEKKIYDLVVDEEMERVAPPLAENELEILKMDLLEHGCKFPLIVWGDMIVDGHNRYRICKEENIPFAIEQMDFADKTEAKLWIVKNQLGRRNLKDFQRCEMVLPLEEEIKEEAEKRRRDAISAARNGTVQTFAPSQKSREILADMAGVSYATLDKVKLIIVEADADTIEKLRSGELKIHTVYTQLKKKDKPKPADEKPEEEPEEQEPVVKDEPEEDPKPIVHIDGPIEVPPMRETPEKTPRPFPFVKDQVRFSVENMLKELQIGLNMLRDEDADKKEELLQMLEDGYSRAKSLIKEVNT